MAWVADAKRGGEECYKSRAQKARVIVYNPLNFRFELMQRKKSIQRSISVVQYS